MDRSLPDLTRLMSRPIAFQRPYAEIAGSAAGGLFLSQAVYWADRSQHDGGWFYISQDQWYEQTMLKRSEQERARKELKKAGVLNEERKGNPARLWYQVDKKNLNALLYKAIEKQQYAESDNQECRKQQSSLQDSTNCADGNLPTVAPADDKLPENQQIAESDNQEKPLIAESDNQECRIEQSSLQDSAHSLTENITESITENTDSDADARARDAATLDGDYVVVRDEPAEVSEPEHHRGIFGSHLITHCHPYLYWFLRCMEDKSAKNPDALGDFVERFVQFGLTGAYCQATLANFLKARRYAIDERLLSTPDAPDHELMEELVDGWPDRAGEFIQEAQEALSDHLDYLKQQMAA